MERLPSIFNCCRYLRHQFRVPTMDYCSVAVLLTALVTVCCAYTSAAPKLPDKGSTDFFTKKMIIGLAAGFGFFFTLALFCCLTWCLCCGGLSDQQKRKVTPSATQRRSRVLAPK